MEVRKVTKRKPRGCKGKRKIKIDYFGNENTVRNTFVRMVNVLTGNEMDKITVGKLRDVEKCIIWNKNRKLHKSN